MRLERREYVPLSYRVAAPFGAVMSALIISAALIALTKVPILDAYRQLAVAAFGSRLSLTETLLRATPLTLTGLSVAVAFRAQLWNIGAEGQFYVGAIAAAALGSSIESPSPYFIVPVLLLTGAVAGMITLLAPVALRLQFGVDEAITGLLLNFIVLLFVRMMVEGPMKDPMAFGWPHSAPIDPNAMLPMLVERSRLHVGFLIALAVALMIWIIQSRTILGFEGRAAGLNASAANFSGISLPAVMVKVAIMSGGLAGLAGAMEVIGVKSFVATDLSPGYGYTGIVVAMLAGLHPLAVVLSALFVASVFVGADGMSRSTGIPSFIADVIVAISLITMLVALLITNYRISQMIHALEIFWTVNLWAAVLRIATPLMFGVLGALLCERAGVLNIGIEGIMTFGAMIGWFAVFKGGGLWMGVLAAACIGALIGSLHGALTVPLGLNQHVTGIGITLLASSLSYYIFRLALPVTTAPPTIVTFKPLNVPGLSDIPFLGPTLFAQTPLTYLGLLFVAIVSYVLFRTPIGLAVRMVGENPHAADAQGISVTAVRMGAVIAGSALMGVGGSYLTLSAFNSFFPTMVQGRGWVCLALVLFALWKPGKALFGALLYGLFDAYQLRLQTLFGKAVPYEVFLMLPYVMSIAALAALSRRAQAPQALLKPFRRGER